MSISKLFETHKWQCPGCAREFPISNRKPDPLLCPDCTRRERHREKKELTEIRARYVTDLVKAPFQFVGNTVKSILVAILLLLLGFIALLVIVGNWGG